MIYHAKSEGIWILILLCCCAAVTGPLSLLPLTESTLFLCISRYGQDSDITKTFHCQLRHENWSVLYKQWNKCRTNVLWKPGRLKSCCNGFLFLIRIAQATWSELVDKMPVILHSMMRPKQVISIRPVTMIRLWHRCWHTAIHLLTARWRPVLTDNKHNIL